MRAVDLAALTGGATAAALVVDPATKEVRRGGVLVSLTAREYAVLEYLIRNLDRVVSKAQILEAVWDAAYDGDDNIIEVYIGYLRRKTEAEGEPRLIYTVRGVGYVLRETPP